MSQAAPLGNGTRVTARSRPRSRAHHDRVMFNDGARLDAVLPDYDDLLETTE
jgi:hypothetical protein